MTWRRAPRFWAERGLPARLLAPVSWLVAEAARLRQRGVEPHRAGVPVICVGNLVAGGAGKTPVALDLLKRLSAGGKKVFALTRGYGGRESGPLLVDPERHDWRAVGDEALLLARVAPTVVSRDRIEGAALAEAEGAEAIVMDDGFQNPLLHKDLNLLVVDGGAGLGNGMVMP
ncbi:MAG: tetraacyldisaccharide 4'-kinase, partial [Limibacillus sp.]